MLMAYGTLTEVLIQERISSTVISHNWLVWDTLIS